jgi:hypothetical protein
MKCNRKNKKLMNNIAIISLVLIIFYIIKNVFFNKQIEGFGGKAIIDYEKDAINVKIDKTSGAGGEKEASKFASYVNIYSKAANRRQQKQKQKDSKANKKSNNIEQDQKDWEDIAKILKKKIGEKTFNKLTEAYLNDPDTEFYEYMKNKKSDNSGAMGIIVKGLFSKIDTLYAEMSKDSSRMKAK